MINRILMGILDLFCSPSRLTTCRLDKAKAETDLATCKTELALAHGDLFAKHIEIARLRGELDYYDNTPLPVLLIEMTRERSQGLPVGAQGKLWCQCLESLREAFVDREIETEEWSHDQVVAAITAHYPNIRPPPQRDVRYRVPKHKDDVMYLADLTWVRWVPSKRDIWDCDEYDHAFAGELSLLGINARAKVWGGSPGGFHSFGLVPCADGLVMTDMTSMQRCATVPLGLDGYTPVEIREL